MSNTNVEQTKISHITSVINQYLQLSNEVKELRRAIKERQYKISLCEESILTFMDDEDGIESIKLSNNDQEIIPVSKNQVKEVSKKNLMEIVETHLKGQDVLDKIKADLESKKTTKTIEKIKVQKIKIGKSSASTSESSAVSDALLGMK